MGPPVEAFLLSQTDIRVIKKGKTTENIVFFLALWVENVCIVEYGGAYIMCVFRAENGHGKPESSQ